jgi:hypothetical protein
MGLPASEQFVLSAIESDLRTTDPELIIAFASFTSVTYRASMPVTEQLDTVLPPASATGIGRRRKIGSEFVLVLAILFLVGALLAAGAVLAFQGRHNNGTGCRAGYTGIQPGGAAAHGCAGTSPGQSQHSSH